MGRGIVNQLAQALADGTPSTKDKARAFIGEATNILDTVRARGYDLGNKQVQAVIDGILGKQPSLKQQLLAALDEANAAAIERLKAARAGWAEAWGSLAQVGMDAIAAKYAGWQPPSLLKAQREAEERERAALQKTINDAQDAIQASFGAALEASNKLAALGTAPPPGMDPEEWQKQVDAAKAVIEKAGTDIAAAQKTLDDALFQQRQNHLNDLAKQQQIDHDKKVAQEQADFAAELKRIQNQMAQHKLTWKQGQDAIIKLFGEYGVDYRNAGSKLGKEFAKGIKDGIAAVGSAVEELADAIAARLKGKSPPKVGPLRDINRWGRTLVKEFLKGLKFHPGDFARIDSGTQGWLDEMLGRARSAQGIAPEGGGGMTPNFANLAQPAWANSDLLNNDYRFAGPRAQDLSDAIDSGTVNTNARLLDLASYLRTRNNWNQWEPWIARILNEMRAERLSGAEAAERYGLAKGGIVTKPTWAMLGEQGAEAVVPLDRYLGPPGRTRIELHINGPIVGSLSRQQADAFAAELESAFARRQRNNGQLAFN
jgi:hypothetical protein